MINESLLGLIILLALGVLLKLFILGKLQPQLHEDSDQGTVHDMCNRIIARLNSPGVQPDGEKA